jgi:Mg-chelatase subunit ChlD
MPDDNTAAPKAAEKTAEKTLVTLLLDRSGSMQSVRDDTVGAINAWLGELRQTENEMRFSLVLFDDHHGKMELQKLHVARPITEVPDLRNEDFRPRGDTPLIDAACSTIRAVRESLEGRDDVKVIFAIQTDGQENASHENGWDGLRALISEREKAGWQFTFMGCGIDAYGQGARMGIRRENTVSYGADQLATRAAFAATGENTRLYASGARADMSYTTEQKMRSGDRFDPEARGNAPAPVTPVIGGLGWGGHK